MLKKFLSPNLYKSFFKFKYFSTVVNQNLLQEIQDEVYLFLKSKDKCNIQKIAPKVSFEELGFDSLDTVELIVELEEKFQIELQNDIAEKIQTVHDAIFEIYKVKESILKKENEQLICQFIQMDFKKFC